MDKAPSLAVSGGAGTMGDRLQAGGLPFVIGPRTPGSKNALACRGQRLDLPEGTVRVHLLVAASEGEVKAEFRAGDRIRTLTIPSWTGYLGSWDNRVFKGHMEELTYSVKNPLERIDPAFLREGRPAWWSSHHHAKGQDAIYEYAYLFLVPMDMPAGARTLTLPQDPSVKIFAATAAARDNGGVRPLNPLLPDLARDPSFQPRYANLAPPKP